MVTAPVFHGMETLAAGVTLQLQAPLAAAYVAQ